MHIGLIGGIGPAATDYYYRGLISAFSDAGAPLELTIAHADSPTLLAHQAAGDADAQSAIFTRLAERLRAAGAQCVVVTSIAGHFCMPAFAAASPLPAIDLITEVDRGLSARGLARLGVLGTQTVMTSKLYGRIEAAELLAPDEGELQEVHDAYIAMATSGVVDARQRTVFDRASHRLIDAGAEAILLGGTDLALVYNEAAAPFRVVDCAKIHVDAIVRAALG